MRGPIRGAAEVMVEPFGGAQAQEHQGKDGESGEERPNHAPALLADAELFVDGVEHLARGELGLH